MNPANDFVEDFVGADRALKRLSLLRVRDIDLWKAPLVRVGEPTAAARAAIAGGRPSASRWSSTPTGRPLGWLSERDLARRDRAGAARHGARTRSSSSTTCCATRSRTCSSPTRQYGPVVDGQRPGRRRAVGRDHLRLPQLRRGDRAARPTPAERVERLIDLDRGRLPSWPQVEIRDRSDASCISQNKLCPGWIVDNFDRYTHPLVAAHRTWSLVSVGDRVRDRVRARAAGPPAALAGRADRRPHRRPLHAARASRSSSCCCRSRAAARRPR